jgi:chlorite dismutase
MNAPQQRPSPQQRAAPPEPSLTPEQGWHCSHFFYRWRRDVLAQISESDRHKGVEEFVAALNPEAANQPARLQSFIISGHKADLGLIMMDPNPLTIDAVHQRLMASSIGMALEPTYSFTSVSEVSEYLPTAETYAARLIQSGEEPGSPAFAAKVAGYEKRLPAMLEHRLAPEFPDWPAMCFYPMNKSRNVGANWFLQPFSTRSEMMSEHAQSGMAFAGKVTQLVTTSVGLDDWEWSVTLWARNPQYLKDIVYKMRFDQASARFGEFGQFYTGYRSTPQAILEHCQIIR